MGMKKYDILENGLNQAALLLAEGKTTEVLAMMQSLKPLIIEEKRRVAKDETMRINYVCKGCFLKCKKSVKFELSENEKKHCMLDGTLMKRIIKKKIGQMIYKNIKKVV